MCGITTISFLLLSPLSVLAAPTASSDSVIPSRVLEARAVVTPAPCQPQLNSPPTEQESAERFEKFAHAFLDTKNLAEAFEYIDATYIIRLPLPFGDEKNHNPLATANGPNAALDALGPYWGSVQITPLRKTFNGEYGDQLIWRNC
ncbi:hypothetical protein QBC32DRAFT_34614 [Pseudoneurospora amorphoporcata]|uniref:Uncharacterized protein n=1 Tax=Pseudoneurospora amorphoporcata TaxID=241081 RepID=A0AAN6P303_9PEZI|nr:hypothetical protein QBC32DRAFT_34614 [Pseudoneurospora amorphoporcata]